MSFKAFVCDTVSGDVRSVLPVSAFSWGRLLNGGASGSATVQLRDPVVSALAVRSLTVPVSNTLVLERDGVVLFAGLIWSRGYSHATGELTLDLQDLWSVWSRRLAGDASASVMADVNLVYSALSPATIAKRVITEGITGPADSNRPLPITFPADVAGSMSRTYYGYHFATVAEVLDDLMNEDNGPDIDFLPRWVSGKLNWLMRAGTEGTPKLSSGSWDWNLSAPDAGPTRLTLVEDAAKLTTNAVSLGEGMERKMLTRSNRIINPIYPSLQMVTAHKTESNTTRLTARANSDLKTYGKPTEQWAFDIMASGTPSVADLQLGGTVRVFSKGDPWVPDGWNDNRLIGFSGDLTERVSLQFQPMGA